VEARNMTGDVDKKWERLKELQAELKRLQEELKQGLSRRNFLGRLKGAGVGFGAAFVLGVEKAAALTGVDGGVSVKSTNPAVDGILTEGAEDQGAKERAGKEPLTRLAYRRFFRRFYRRGYRRFFYRRFYGRYRRFYRRFYRRGYRRFYRRW
jgi:hypothetical protein